MKLPVSCAWAAGTAAMRAAAMAAGAIQLHQGDRTMTDHINRRRWLLGSAGLAAALAGCGGGIDDDVRLRAVNATEDIDSIDIDYNDWTFAFDVRQGGDVTSYAQRQVLVIGAFGLFEVFRARDSLRLYDDNRSLPEGDTASVVVMGGRDAGIRLRLLDEDADPPFNGDRLRLRVLHALPGVGALDVHLTAADTPRGQPASPQTVAPGGATSDSALPTGSACRSGCRRAAVDQALAQLRHHVDAEGADAGGVVQVAFHLQRHPARDLDAVALPRTARSWRSCGSA
jgi:hypothetical protein